MSQKLFAVLLTATLSVTAFASEIKTKGFDFRPNIVGGVDAIKGEFPFQVSLQSSSGSHFCGGSLIKTNWVLTAAHCVAGWNKANKIVVGLHDRQVLAGSESFTAAKVIPHPQYNRQTLDYDYALIQLSGDSAFAPIALNNQEIAIPEDGTAINVWTAGWGTVREGSYGLPRILQKVEVPLVTTKACNAPASYNGDITDRMICAGLQQGGKDSCQGDSGGPLFVKETSGAFLLVGVVSWGEGCARANKYGVYAKVNNQIDWIAQQTQ
jgi:trypsin